jgi:uncharacterized protein (UPF0333 family)
MQKFSKNSLLFLIVLLVVVSVVALFYKPIKESFVEGAAPAAPAAPVSCSLKSSCDNKDSTMKDKNNTTLYCRHNNKKELVWHDKVGANNYNPHIVDPKTRELKNYKC